MYRFYKMKLIFLFFYIIIRANASKCPEPKKPHQTSCTIFYNCVNLPSGGYVWVPAKCTDGLIFQPYLRICVVPGDSWTCDILSTEEPFVTNKYETPELINPNESSYSTIQKPSQFSELIDSSYTTNAIPDMSDQQMITTYPLIEIDQSTKMEKNKENANSRVPIIINHREKNYVFINGQKATSELLMGEEKRVGNNYQLLNQWINRLLIYKQISIPMQKLFKLFLPPLANNIDINAVQLNNRFEPEKKYEKSVLTNYFIQNYMQGKNEHNTVITLVQPHTKIEINNNATDLNTPNSNSSETLLNIPQNMSLTQIDSIDVNNNIIMIGKSSGQKEYLTVNKYKSMQHQFDSETITILPCTKNVRLQNVTDCNKYYICEPRVASVMEHHCAPKTAFNKYTRVCDIESYKICHKRLANKERITITRNVDEKTTLPHLKAPAELCTELGKLKDPVSHSHYHICYSASDTSKDIKSIRKKCPNNLIFCQSRKVCTTTYLCNDSQTT